MEKGGGVGKLWVSFANHNLLKSKSIPNKCRNISVIRSTYPSYCGASYWPWPWPPAVRRLQMKREVNEEKRMRMCRPNQQVQQLRQGPQSWAYKPRPYIYRKVWLVFLLIFSFVFRTYKFALCKKFEFHGFVCSLWQLFIAHCSYKWIDWTQQLIGTWYELVPETCTVSRAREVYIVLNFHCPLRLVEFLWCFVCVFSLGRIPQSEILQVACGFRFGRLDTYSFWGGGAVA